MIFLTETIKKQSLVLYLFSICTFYFCMPSMGIMTPTMATLAQAFPNVPFISITYVGTIVALFQIVGSAIGGAVAGKYLKFRTTLLLAYALYLIGGIGPYFLPDGSSWTTVLFFRTIFGLGLGLNVPMGATLISRLYRDEKKRAQMMGFGMFFFNVGAFGFSYLGPVLAMVSWQTAFLAHCVGLVGLVGAILLKEPPDSEEVKKEKVKITPKAILWPLIFAIEMTLVYSMFTMGSMVLSQAGMDPSKAGLLQGTGIAVLTAVGFVLSLGFGMIYRFLNKWIVAVSLAFVTIGLFLTSASGSSLSIPLFLTGWVFFGIGQQCITNGLPMVVSTVVDKATAGAALGLTFAFMNFGGFTSTPWAQLVAKVVGATTASGVIRTNAVVFTVFTVVMIIVTMRMKKFSTEGNDEISAK